MTDSESTPKKAKTTPKRGILIACSGKAGSGKDTVGNYLLEKHGFNVFSFATALKQIVSIIFDWPYDTLLANTPQKRLEREALPTRTLGDETWNYREALQIIGTDLFRNKLSPTIWTDIIALKIEPLLQEGENVAITDARFLSEVDMVKAKGGTSILLWRKEGDLRPLPNEHVSENEFLIRKDEMIIVRNTSDSKNDLFNEIDKILANL